jgi:hypothetical protein
MMVIGWKGADDALFGADGRARQESLPRPKIFNPIDAATGSRQAKGTRHPLPKCP